MSGTFLFDGDCAFCTSCARFLRRWVRTPASIEPWQFADLDALGVTPEQCAESVQWIESSPAAIAVPVRPAAVVAGPLAFAGLLRTAVGWSGRLVWRPAGVVLGVAPVRALAWLMYRWIARNRHRLPGGTPACALPARRPA
jgi:predicted DCC family thiol-disulfide oxidoreductase YuxK